LTVLRNQHLFSLLILAAFTAAGCGSSDMPELGDVYGQVTLDGKPVSKLNILFSPEKGRAAGGVTDEEGRYELKYLEGYSGSKVGPAKVTFEWEPGVEPTANIPAKYMQEGFNVEVKSGSNELNFPMTSN
jgi:hypothetical protein